MWWIDSSAKTSESRGRRLLRGRPTNALRATGEAAMRNGALRRAALRLAAARGRALALVYHRIRSEGPAPHEIVRAMPSSLVRQQIAALGELGDIVTLADLARDAERPGTRVRFALSFDDDDVGHTRVALPLLRSLQVSATFFLSGRVLHGLGPYWWVTLEHLIAERGLTEVCQTLGVAASSPVELAARCEGTSLVNRIVGMAQSQDVQPAAAEIRALIDGGMSIGFHTVRHLVLPTLSPEALGDELVRGRVELATAAGRPVALLAYPHGRAATREARAAREAGYHAAFTGGGHPITVQTDRFLLDRWEPGALGIDDFVAAVALRLNRPAGAR